jgi:transcriptional regulator with XRE-family HTH domain
VTSDQERLELASRIRALRLSAGLTGTELADRLRISQSKVSKIETGRMTPSASDVRTIAGALDAPPAAVEELAEQAESLADRTRRWRATPRPGARPQQRIVELEAAARTIRTFQAGIVPALLQTADYTRGILAQGRPDDGDPEAAAVIARRVSRQAVLFDTSKQFEFVMWEAALRQRLCGAQVMAAQLDRLISLSSLPNVEIGILSFDVELEFAPLNGFVIFDERAAVVDAGPSELLLRDPDDVRFYAQAFASYRRVASFAESASALLLRLDADWRKASVTAGGRRPGPGKRPPLGGGGSAFRQSRALR